MQVSKYSASGNDFVIFHSLIKKDRSLLAKRLCDRHEGVGADGLIVIVPHETADFEWQFYNSDGSNAAMCGNGTRACAHYAYRNGLAPKVMQFMTEAGIIVSTVDGNVVESQMTDPVMKSEPFEAYGHHWYFYDTGVPHLVSYVDDLRVFDIELARKMRYEYNANVNFAKVGSSLHVRTYERGVEDETLACGTGMVACFYAAFQEGKVSSSMRVFPASGEELSVRFHDNKLYFKGEVRSVFDAVAQGINDL